MVAQVSVGSGADPSGQSSDLAAPPGGAWYGRRMDRWIATGLFGLAILMRLGVVRSSGGFRALNGYDDGVYFSATAAVLHGLVPYRDFVLLHPPGILVVGAGPMALAHLLGLSDADTFVMVRVLFVCLGGLNSVLTFLAGRHASRSAGVVAGCLYAVWAPAIREERTMLLEPLVILGTLSALALVPPLSNRMVTGRWRPILAGLIGGVAVSTKLWAVIPILVIAVAQAWAGAWRRALAYLATAAATALVIAGPFLVLAPGQMWAMLVESQVGRPSRGENRLARFAEMGDLLTWPFSALADPSWPPIRPVGTASAQEAFFASGRAPLVVGVVVIAVTGVAAVVAARLPPARVWVALVVIQAGALLAVPVFFGGYASFVAPAGMLLVGAGGHLVWTSSFVRSRKVCSRVAASGFAVAVALAAWGAIMADRGAPVSRRVAPLVASARCVASDSPALLVLVDRLSRNLDNGCPAVFDFSGVGYTLDYPRDRPIGPSALRAESAQYQQFAQQYFEQADYVILHRRSMTGLSPETLAILERRPLVLNGPRTFGPAGQ